MLDPDDSCLACHRLPTMLSSDLVTMLSATVGTGWWGPPALLFTPCEEEDESHRNKITRLCGEITRALNESPAVVLLANHDSVK